MCLCLGITGSLSATSAVLARTSGEFVGAYSEPAGSLHYREMPDALICVELRHLTLGVARAAARNLNEHPNSILDKVSRVVIAVAGLDERFDAVMMASYLRELPIPQDQETLIRGIGEAGFCSAFKGGLGILVRAGIGCTVFACNRGGERHVTNAWGFLPGDLGGSYHIGQLIWHRLTRSADARADAQETDFASKVLRKFGAEARVVDFFDEYCRVSLHDNHKNMKFAARLANTAFELAEEEHHPVAEKILDEASVELQCGIDTVIERLGLNSEKEVPVAFHGSAIERHPAYARVLFERAKATHSNLTFSNPQIGWNRTVGVALLGLAHRETHGAIPWNDPCERFVNSLPENGQAHEMLRTPELHLRGV